MQIYIYILLEWLRMAPRLGGAVVEEAAEGRVREERGRWQQRGQAETRQREVRGAIGGGGEEAGRGSELEG